MDSSPRNLVLNSGNPNPAWLSPYEASIRHEEPSMAGDTGGGVAAPAPETGGGGTQRPAGERSISLTRAEYDKLVGAQHQVKELTTERDRFKSVAEESESLKNHLRVMTSDGATEDARDKSTRAVLAGLGYTPEQINEWTRQAEPEGEPPTSSQPDRSEQTAAEVAQLRQQVQQAELRRLRTLKDSQVKEALGPQLAELVALLPEESRAEAAQMIQEDASDLTLEYLKERRQDEFRRTGNTQFDDSWMTDAAKKAAKKAIQKARLFAMGQRNLSGAPDGDMQATLERVKKVPEPTWESGKDIGDIQQEANQWAAAQLIEGAIQAEGSRV